MADEKEIEGGVVLVYVDNYPRMIALLRTARRYAQRRGLPWVALHSENRHHPDGKEKRVRVLQAMTLAEEMGGTTETIEARTPFEAVRVFAEKQREHGMPVQMVFIGEVSPPGFFARLFPSLASRLRKVLSCQVETVSLEGEPLEAKPWFGWRHITEIPLMHVLYAVAGVAAAVLFIEGLNDIFPEAFRSAPNRRTPFIIATAFIAGRFGLVPGLITALVGYITLRLTYVYPSLESLMMTPGDALSFFMFIAVAMILGLWVHHTRLTGQQREEQLQRMQALFRMYHVSMRAATYEKTLEALHQELARALKTEIIFFLPPPFNPERLEPAMPREVGLNSEDHAALTLCWTEAKVVGFGTAYYHNCPFRFKPLVTPTAAIGVMAIRMDRKSVADESYRRLLSSIADSVALILERVTMSQAMEDIRMREEREKLRAMLLSSVSHDLKTPLASVIGSLSVYRSVAEQLPEVQRVMLIQTALDEAQRLDSFITNILDMTRLESGQIRFREEWITPSLLMRHVVKRLHGRLQHHRFTVQRPSAGDGEVGVDVMMMEQVLQNILDNAVKYTPQGAQIDVNWGMQGNHFQIQVRDNGPGIPDGQFEKIFDKYARIRRQDSQVAGTGLGLAIARAILQAQGGGISANNHPEGGAVFTITLPKWRKLEQAEDKKVA
jgi:two-component system, OmpR family, sensor histidine kinase KdpD